MIQAMTHVPPPDFPFALQQLPAFVRGKPLPDHGPLGIYRRFQKIVLESTNRCPNSCVFCKYRQNTKKGSMSFFELEHLLRTLPPHIGEVDLSGSGEPLLLDDLPERTRLIKYHWPDASITIITSLNVPRNMRYFTRLLQSGVSTIGISCYGHTAEDYHALFGRDAFEDMRRNLEVLTTCARQFNVNISVHTFLQTDVVFNIREPEQKRAAFVEYLRAHGVTDIIAKPIYSGQGRLALPNVKTVPPPFPCSVVWGFRAGQLIVSWDLEVWPCCFIMHEKGGSLGNLREVNLATIYASPRYLRLYESHWDGSAMNNFSCKACTHPNSFSSYGEQIRLAAYQGIQLAGIKVYFWGCGETYHKYKLFFAQTKPQCILLDTPGDRPDEVDGISVRHPDEVLTHGEKLPIIIFASPENNAVIMDAICARYQEWQGSDIVPCIPDMGTNY
jgi:MoaA/NifB/PqqE/SkfB family radical SAM enzyme